jgi:tetratricopeptide (TPR) repeat protein
LLRLAEPRSDHHSITPSPQDDAERDKAITSVQNAAVHNDGRGEITILHLSSSRGGRSVSCGAQSIASSAFNPRVPFHFKDRTRSIVALKVSSATSPLPDGPVPSRRWFERPEFLALTLFVVVIAVFWPSLHGAFIYFDEHWEVEVPNIQSGLKWNNLLWSLQSLDGANWYPLTRISHMADCQFFGTNPWGHHLTSVVLHAIDAALLFGVLHQLTGARWRSWIVAALFALHPLRVESVAWISERKDVLSTMFWLLAIGSYAHWSRTRVDPPGEPARRPRSAMPSRHYWFTWLFLVLGLMSKPSVVMLPATLLLLDVWPLGRWPATRARVLLLEKLPFFATVILSSWLTYTAQGNAGMMTTWGSLSPGARLANIPISYCRYLEKMFWPSGLCVLYPHPGHWPPATVAGAAAFLCAVTIAAVATIRRRPVFFVGWSWYLISLIPMIGIIQVGPQSMADRYTYVPSIGILLIVAWMVPQGRGPARVSGAIAAAAVAAIAACIAVTHYQIGFWQNGVTVWRRAATVTKDNFVAHENLGVILCREIGYAQALPEFEEVVRLRPDFLEGEFYLGGALAHLNRRPEGIPHLRIAAAATWSGTERSKTELAMALVAENQPDEAVRLLEETIQARPRSAELRVFLAIACNAQGQTRKAIECYRQALQIDSHNVIALNNLAWVLATDPDAENRNGAEAIPLAELACATTGYQQPKIISTLAAAYAEAGRFEEAVAAAEKAGQLWEAQGNQSMASVNKFVVQLYKDHKPAREARAVSH